MFKNGFGRKDAIFIIVALPKVRTPRIVKSMSSTSSHWMPNSYGFYRKAEDAEVRFYGMVNAHIASKMISFRINISKNKEKKKERKKKKEKKEKKH